jgi:hypothetical protein
MESIGLYLVAGALTALGCAATVISAQLVPMEIRVRGQDHGRFAGLSAAEPTFVDGSKRNGGGSGGKGSLRLAPQAVAA